MHRIARIGTVGALAGALFIAGGIGVFRASRSDGDARAAAAAGARTDGVADPAVGGGGDLGDAIATLQQRLIDVPGDWRAFASLGLAYVQQARVSADPSYYPKAQGVLRHSLALHPQDNEEALVGMAALAAARHDFSAALRFGLRARKVDPYDANVYGVIGDAQVELGRYDDAFTTFQTMVDTKPSLSSYARVSYARELRGDVAGAIASMEAARQVAGTPADVAWTSYQLGDLFFNDGRFARAEREYRRGLHADPDYVPNDVGLAKTAWARGDLPEAVDGYVDAVRRFPSPEYVAALGDLYAQMGDRSHAAQQYDLVRAEADLFAANGVNTDLELALFDADHGDPEAALRAARAEWRRRTSVQVADALAWALHVNGRDPEAARFARRALSLGTRNALFQYHAGMIQLGLGHDAHARELLGSALETNPAFSIMHAPSARHVLASLREAA
jgi:tetratricopeptide (TPR) repeat protein